MKTRRSAHGFTLVELLVVILIVIVLATLGFMFARTGLRKAAMAANLQNLRSLGGILTSYSADQNAYPAGWSFARGESWATQVVKELHGDSAKQDPILLSPLVAKSIPADLKGPTVSNYGVSPFIFAQEGPEGYGYRVRPASLRRPSEQILLGDALPRSENQPYGFSMIVWWGMRGSASGNSYTQPPISPESRAETNVQFPGNILEMTTDGSKGLPAFRNDGKCHLLFADGHVEGMVPDQVKFKHFAISY